MELILLLIVCLVLSMPIMVIVAVVKKSKESRKEREQHEAYLEGLRQKEQQELQESNRKASEAKEIHKKVAAEFASLYSSCEGPWSEISRTLRVLHAQSVLRLSEAIIYDVVNILAGFYEAGRSNDWDTLVGFFYVISDSVGKNYSWKDCDSTLRSKYLDRKPPELPITVRVLGGYEQVTGKPHPTQHDPAFTFCSLLVAVSDRLPGSHLVELLASKYFVLLKPYIRSGQFTGERTSNIGNRDCPECSKYYPVLRLKQDAKEEEVKTAFRDLAQIYHPDKCSSGNDRVRQTAEREMKQLNAAYEHIMKHFECVKA